MHRSSRLPPRRRRSVLRPAGAVLAVALSGLLVSCAAPAAPAPRPTSSPTSSATPEPSVDPLTAEVDERLAAMSTRQKISSLLMLHQPGTDGAALAEFMRSTGAGGFIVMGDNVGGTVDQVAAATAALTIDPALPPLIGIDEEGGVVARLDEDTFPSAEQLKNEAPDATRAAFAARAELVRRAGANLNFGIVADMTGDPDSFIFDRVYGATAEDAGSRVEQAVAGEHGIVLSTLKHFPGHGRSEADSHSTIPVTDVGYDEWRVTDAVPFERGVTAGAEAVMFGHLAYTSVDGQPASLSPRWHEILRTELHFDGLAVTDDMLMLQHTDLPEFQDPVENGIRAISAGNDVLVYVLAQDADVSGVDPNTLIDGLTAAADSGRILPAVLDDAARRVLAARISER